MIRYEVGDTVSKLIDPSFIMTVTGVEKDRIICSWVDNLEKEQGIFNPWELKMVKMHDGEENFSQNRNIQL